MILFPVLFTLTQHCLVLASAKDDGVTLLYGDRNLFLRDDTGLNQLTFNSRVEQDIIGVEFDWKSGCNFWTTSSGNGSIEKMCNGRHHKITKNRASDYVAFDWVTENLYWSSFEPDGRITVTSNNAKLSKLLIDSNFASKPRAIALNPAKGYFYWTDWGSDPYIGKAGMDGSYPTKIVKKTLVWPNDILYDFENQEIYWNDAGMDYIAKADENGNNVQYISGTSGLSHLFGMSIYKRTLYITEWESRAIYGLNLDNATDRTLIQGDLTRVMGIKVVDPTRQPHVAKKACTCTESQLCLLTPKKKNEAVCVCPDGSKLSQGGDACIEIHA